MYKSEKQKVEAKCLLACSLDTDKEIFRELIENCFAVFDQSSHVILLTWYCQLDFFPLISRNYSLDGSLQDF